MSRYQTRRYKDFGPEPLCHPSYVLILGNTFPVKDEIKRICKGALYGGAVWDAESKGWRVPPEHAAQCLALVGSNLGSQPYQNS